MSVRVYCKNCVSNFRKVQRPEIQPVLAEEDTEIVNFDLSNKKSVSPTKCKKESKRGSLILTKTETHYFSKFFFKWKPQSRVGTLHLNTHIKLIIMIILDNPNSGAVIRLLKGFSRKEFYSFHFRRNGKVNYNIIWILFSSNFPRLTSIEVFLGQIIRFCSKNLHLLGRLE